MHKSTEIHDKVAPEVIRKILEDMDKLGGDYEAVWKIAETVVLMAMRVSEHVHGLTREQSVHLCEIMVNGVYARASLKFTPGSKPKT